MHRCEYYYYYLHKEHFQGIRTIHFLKCAFIPARHGHVHIEYLMPTFEKDNKFFFTTHKPWSKTIKIRISVYVLIIERIIEPI